jgi:riboflavin kinase/FMN adenylyltransferase
VGANFLFGRDRSGNFSLLRSLGARYGFRAEKIDPVRYREFVVSSTRIRRLVAEGRVDEAAALLGHYHYIDGVVTKGAGRGRRIGFPTLNLQTDNELLPPLGVYATTLTLDGTIYRSITNVGVRPTFESQGAAVVETHVFGFDRDIYGRAVRLSFVRRMRPERTFPDVDALVAQIQADCRHAQALFDRLSP